MRLGLISVTELGSVAEDPSMVNYRCCHRLTNVVVVSVVVFVPLGLENWSLFTIEERDFYRVHLGIVGDCVPVVALFESSNAVATTCNGLTPLTP